MEYVIRIIGYVCLLGITGGLYYFLHSHFLFMALCLMGVFFALSAVCAGWMSKKVSVFLSAGEPIGRQGECVYLKMQINNPTWITCLDAKVLVEVGNPFFATQKQHVFAVPIYAKKGYELELPIVPTFPGILQFRVLQISVKDLMGLFPWKVKCDADVQVSIMPEILTEINYEKTALEQGMLESEESSKRGNDFSDVQEIREYIPGDKLMSIHWKLSAKRDILMVKDRVSMSDHQLVVLPELCNQDHAMLAGILSATYTLIKTMLAEHTTVLFLYWSKNRYEYEQLRIDYEEQLIQAFVRMYYESCYDSMQEAAEHMALVHPEMKAYMHVYADASGVKIVIRENE